MSPLARLRALGACAPALEWAATQPTLRAAWEACGERSWLTWVIGAAHTKGTLPRTRLVACALRWVEPVAHLLPDESVLDLVVVAQWTIGLATLDEVRAAQQRLRNRRYAHAYADAAAASYADDAAAANAAFCDVIRASISVDDVCAALGLDPDAPLAEKEAA